MKYKNRSMTETHNSDLGKEKKKINSSHSSACQSHYHHQKAMASCV
jgi:hypothetical protein